MRLEQPRPNVVRLTAAVPELAALVAGARLAAAALAAQDANGAADLVRVLADFDRAAAHCAAANVADPREAAHDG
jgi:hypothetical protein